MRMLTIIDATINAAAGDVNVQRITWKGYGAGGFTVDLLKDLARGLVKKQIEEYTGVKL
jgi:hypothetical protein